MKNELRSNITAIILAGGQSSRMGRDKALISLEDTPFLRKIYLLAQEFAAQVYVITPWPEKYQDLLPYDCLWLQEVSLAGERESHGPLVGFAQALAKVNTDWVLLLACDLPQLDQSEVASWMQQLLEVPSEAIALLPKTAKGWEPLSGFYRSSCLPLLRDFIEQGGRSFQNWLALHPVAELAVSTEQVLFNCNTPEDLEYLINASSTKSKKRIF